MTLDEIVKLTPNTGAASDEPSLEDILLRHYGRYFPKDHARRLTHAYIQELKEEIHAAENPEPLERSYEERSRIDCV